MASPGLAVSEESHQLAESGSIHPLANAKRMWTGECKSNLTTQVLVAPAL